MFGYRPRMDETVMSVFKVLRPVCCIPVLPVSIMLVEGRLKTVS